MVEKTGEIQDKKILGVIDKFAEIEKELNSILIDRNEPIRLAIICMIARENMILLGPPGTAKSMLTSELCSRIDNASYFQRLLTKFTRDSELFISGQGIIEEEGKDPFTGAAVKITRIRSYHENMLPCAHIAFLDEVFKANSAILNSLLTIINERLFYTEDGKAVKSDLISLFGASNERPAAEDGLEALYDRFMVRYYVDYLAGDDFIRLLSDGNVADGGGKSRLARIKLEDLNAVNAYLDNISAGGDIIKGIYLLKEKLTDDPKLSLLKPSDRRMKNSIKLLKASALLDRRNYVDKSDVERVYPYILWDTAPGATSNVKSEMLRYLKEKIRYEAPSIDKLGTYRKMAEEMKKKLAEAESRMKNAGTDKISALKVFEKFEQETEIIELDIQRAVKELNAIDMEAGADHREITKIISDFNITGMFLSEKFAEYVRHMKKLGDI